jgi:hypothetical protein
MTFSVSTAIFAYHFNRRTRRTYWQENEVNFVHLGIAYLIHSRKKETGRLYSHTVCIRQAKKQFIARSIVACIVNITIPKISCFVLP